MPKRGRKAHEGLTTQEELIAARLVAGERPKVIGYDLGLDSTAIKYRMKRIRRKLSAATNYQAIAIFARKGPKNEG